MSLGPASRFDARDLAARIAHAQSYPFARPAASYLFAGGVMQPLPDDACRGRVPVIASGSNASPHRLAAKFGKGQEIPVIRAFLHDIVVVFAGHFTAYGALPATLCPHPGAVTVVWITWLTASQLTVMHRSEGVIGCREAAQRYDYVELSRLDLRPETRVSGIRDRRGMTPIGRMPSTGAPIRKAGAYLSRRMFAPDGAPVRFAEVPSANCDLPAASHPAALKRAAALLEPKARFTAFMAGVLDGVDRRQALFQRLTPYSLQRDIAWPDGMVARPSVTP